MEIRMPPCPAGFKPDEFAASLPDADSFDANSFAVDLSADLLRAASSSCAVVSEGEGGLSCRIVFRRRLAPPAPAPRGRE